MPRIRTIKPEFWTDEKLSLLDPITRLVFLGLISNADDAGRLLDNLKWLDGAIFPNTDDSCREALDTLARLSRITRYRSASGQSVIQIANWSSHQKVDKPSKHVLPGPETAVVTQPKVARRDSKRLATPSRDSRETLASSSRSDLGPRTLDLGPRTSDRTATDDRKKPRSSRTGRQHVEPPLFAEFWARYPKRAGSNPRRRALQAYARRLTEGFVAADIIRGLDRYIAYLTAAGKLGTEFVLQAATFVGPDRRWEETWEVPPGAAEPDKYAAIVAEEDAALARGEQLVARRLAERGGAHP